MKKIFAISILSLALLLSLTGCWGSSSPSATASPSPMATATPSAAPSSGISSGSLWSEGDSTDMAGSGSMAGSMAGSAAGSMAGSSATSSSAVK